MEVPKLNNNNSNNRNFNLKYKQEKIVKGCYQTETT